MTLRRRFSPGLPFRMLSCTHTLAHNDLSARYKQITTGVNALIFVRRKYLALLWRSQCRF